LSPSQQPSANIANIPWSMGLFGTDVMFEWEMKELARLRKRKEPRHRVLPPKSAFLDSLLIQINLLAEQGGAVEDTNVTVTPGELPPSHLSDAFSVYLAAYLINFDPEFTDWWTTGIKYQMPYSIRPRYRALRSVRIHLVRKDFQEIARQLRRKCSKIPVQQLALTLERFYQHPKTTSPESRQLALLLAMLPKEGQDVVEGSIKRVWKDEPGFYRSSGHLPLRLDSNIVLLRRAGFYAPKMMPNNMRPVLDSTTGGWMVPDPFAPPKENRFPFTPADLRREIPPVAPSLGWAMLLLGLSGALSCMLTNAVVLPLDVVKTFQQTSEVGLSLAEAAKEVLRDRGALGFVTGFGAMMMNELCLGLIMYPGVELGKLGLSQRLGPDFAKSGRGLIVVVSTMMATVVSCLAQSPWEAAKIRTQALPSYGANCFRVVQRMAAEHGIGCLFGGYVPLLCRMTFYNIAKFIVFDGFNETVIKVFPMLGAANFRTLMTLLKGFVAGIAATFVSQPADAMLTRMMQDDDITDLWAAGVNILEHKGLGGFFSGFFIRSVWSAAKIALQFFCYDRIKSAFYDLFLFGVN